VFGDRYYAVAFTAGGGTIYVQNYYPNQGEDAFSCSTGPGGAGLLSCTDGTNTMFQYCHEGDFTQDPTGASLDSQVDGGCQGITLTAVPIGGVV